MRLFPADLAITDNATDDGLNNVDVFLTAIDDMTTECKAFKTPDARKCDLCSDRRPQVVPQDHGILNRKHPREGSWLIGQFLGQVGSGFAGGCEARVIGFGDRQAEAAVEPCDEVQEIHRVQAQAFLQMVAIRNRRCIKIRGD